LSSNTIIKTILSKTTAQPLLSLNMKNINLLFPGFIAGDFALIHGSPAVHTLATMLCIRGQLPPQLGGLGTDVIFIDGANTFRLYQTTRLARLHRLDPKQALDRIHISRAFTAYQMTALILQKLEDTLKTINAKLAIISDIAAMFLDKDVQDEETKRIYSQVTNRLADISKKQQIIVVATYPPHTDSQRNIYLQALTAGRANVILKLRQTKYEREVILEKHPTFTLGSADLPTETLPLTAFMESQNGRNS
jgi:predicted ATP-dependent serine protease